MWEWIIEFFVFIELVIYLVYVVDDCVGCFFYELNRVVDRWCKFFYGVFFVYDMSVKVVFVVIRNVGLLEVIVKYFVNYVFYFCG